VIGGAQMARRLFSFSCSGTSTHDLAQLSGLVAGDRF